MNSQRFLEILSFTPSVGFTLAISLTTACSAVVVAGKRKETGLWWLAAAAALYFLGLFLGRIAVSSPGIEYSVKLWLGLVSNYAPFIASISALVGWCLLSKKKKEPNQAPEPTAPSGRGSS